MTGVPSLEPLADYLKPQFGNIYVYGLTDVNGFEVQPWTDELRQAIGKFLLEDGPKELVTKAFPCRDGEAEDRWVADILQFHQPWEVAYDLHLEVIRSMSSLDVLIGHLQVWPSEDERSDDAAFWLEKHAAEPQLMDMAVLSDHADLLKRPYLGDLGSDLVRVLEPPELLRVWHEVSSAAPSDLTDAEWNLIEPFIPASISTHNTVRSAINGMLYWSENKVPWSHIPRRYGAWRNIYQRYHHYKWAAGPFARMVEALQSEPEAARLVEWLRQHSQ